jgi:hypothetical protein
MRQIARTPLGSELQKTEARASMLQRQSPAPIETNGCLSREGEGSRKPVITVVCELIARMFSYLFEKITRLFADHGSVSAVMSRATEPSELAVNPPIGKQFRRQIIDSPRREPAIMSEDVAYELAPQNLSAFFPKEDAARVTRPAPESSSEWSARTPGSSTTPSRSPRRSIQQISATSRLTHRSDNSPAIGTSGNRDLTSSANPNSRMLLTYTPPKKTPE